MQYPDGQKVCLGDEVNFGFDTPGRVVCLLNDCQFSEDFPEDVWSHLEDGLLISSMTDKPDLFHYEEPDEDFSLIKRAS